LVILGPGRQICFIVPSPAAVLWVLRGAWLVLPALLGPALADALDGRGAPLPTLVLVALWGAWAVGLVALLVPSTASLTIVRLLAPLALVVAVIAAIAGAGPLPTALAVAGSLVVVLLGFTAETGLAMVQGSAYGDERRYPLRPPAALLAGPVVLVWVLLAGPLVAGVLLLGVRQWVLGAVLLVIGIALTALVGPRLHQLSRRFLVLVPAGFVVHDPVLLADTAMFRRQAIAGLALALEGTTATDMTGRTLGNALEVRLVEPAAMVVATGTGRNRRGEAREVRAFLVAPSRPGRLLEEAARRGYPVGWTDATA
jgi:hypothetical protein